ncbi:zinc ribbon domain-containing protein [Oscillibacter hominis]|uniref:Zinc ribbon domain-containing protein n=1 Tax=Oscillibacter hominis TaxID=2763056 RepID=A0A7G9B210_9FIRM|nr:DUF6320 domain-containing protein [Oscillibacter hominis]QNL43591.1 zinc ribbon domain-containing protein [Oscillibacter hominis]
MPYCVNCGVEMNPGAQACPLCQTPAWHPEQDEPSYFPTTPAQVTPASKRALAALLSSMLGSVSLCCGLLNLVLKPGHPWSLYVIGAALMLWVWFVLPLLSRRLPIFFRLSADVAAVGVYVYLISLGTDGQEWFFHLALPILGILCADVFLLSFLLQGHRRSMLSSMALTIAAIGLFVLGLEFCIDRYLHSLWHPTWSLVVAVACIALIVPLRIVRRVPSLREEARRRFHM